MARDLPGVYGPDVTHTTDTAGITVRAMDDTPAGAQSVDELRPGRRSAMRKLPGRDESTRLKLFQGAPTRAEVADAEEKPNERRPAVRP